MGWTTIYNYKFYIGKEPTYWASQIEHKNLGVNIKLAMVQPAKLVVNIT